MTEQAADTIIVISILCNADANCREALLPTISSRWTLDYALHRYRRGGFETMPVAPVDPDAERKARLIGAAQGIQFRRFLRWGAYPIKAYGPIIDRTNAPDFQSWDAALIWVKTQVKK